MELLPRHEPLPPGDPRLLIPDLGPHTRQLFCDARWSPTNPDGILDGKVLADAEPIGGYDEFERRIAARKAEGDYNPNKIVAANMVLPEYGNHLFVAPPGMPFDDYVLEVRKNQVGEPMQSQGQRTGARFRWRRTCEGRYEDEWYLWDNFMNTMGYAATGNWGEAVEILDNFTDMIDQYGYPFNGNSVYYAGRSQVPLYFHMVRLVGAHYGDEAYLKYLPAMEKYYNFWMAGQPELARMPPDQTVTHRRLVRLLNGAFLNRYWDDTNNGRPPENYQPRLEAYKEDWEESQEAAAHLPREERARHAAEYLVHKQGAAESGHDFSAARWSGDGRTLRTIRTIYKLPADLECLLADGEAMIARAYGLKRVWADAQGNHHEAQLAFAKQQKYQLAHAARIDTINQYNFDPQTGTYRDYDYGYGTHTEALSIVTMYALYSGITRDPQRTLHITREVKERLLGAGGFVVTETETGEQWDAPNAWMLTNWAAVRGAVRAAARIGGDAAKELLEFAHEGRRRSLYGVEVYYDRHHKAPEKVNGRNPHVDPVNGEYGDHEAEDPPFDFAMTTEGYIALKALNIDEEYERLYRGYGTQL